MRHIQNHRRAACHDLEAALLSRGKKDEAAATIPLSMVEDVALVGPLAKIKDEAAKWRETCITTFLVGGPAPMLSRYAEALLG